MVGGYRLEEKGGFDGLRYASLFFFLGAVKAVGLSALEYVL